MAITRTALGTDKNKAGFTSISLTSGFSAGDILIVCYAGDSGLTAASSYLAFGVADTEYFDTYWTQDAVATNSGNVVAEIWRYTGTHASKSWDGIYPYLAVAGAGGGSLAVTLIKLAGLASSPKDGSSAGTGNGATPSSGATGTLAQTDEMAIGCVGTEGPVEDAAGDWNNSSPAAFTAGQRDGTTGGGAGGNITVSEGYYQTAATSAVTAAKQNIAGRDWAACVVTYKASGGVTPHTATPSDSVSWSDGAAGGKIKLMPQPADDSSSAWSDAASKTFYGFQTVTLSDSCNPSDAVVLVKGLRYALSDDTSGSWQDQVARSLSAFKTAAPADDISPDWADAAALDKGFVLAASDSSPPPADGLSAQEWLGASVADSSEWSDAATLVEGLSYQVSDSSPWSDGVARTLGELVSPKTAEPVDQSAAWSDDVSSTLTHAAALSDSAPWDDSVAASVGSEILVPLSDSIPWSDSASKSLYACSPRWQDAIQVTTGGAIELYPSDSISWSDAVSKALYGMSSRWQDAVAKTLVELGATPIEATPSDSVSWSDGTPELYGDYCTNLEDSLAWSDVVEAAAAGVLTAAPSDSVSWSDSPRAFLALAAQLSDGISWSDSIAGFLTLDAQLADSADWSDQVSKDFRGLIEVHLADVVSWSDFVVKDLVELVTPKTVTPSDFMAAVDGASLTLGYCIFLSDQSAAPTDAVSGFFSLSASLSDSIAWQDGVTKELAGLQPIESSPSDSNADNWADTVGGFLTLDALCSDATSWQDQISATFRGFISVQLSDSWEGWQDSAVGLFTEHASLADGSAWSDSVSGFYTESAALSDSIAWDDSVARTLESIEAITAQPSDSIEWLDAVSGLLVFAAAPADSAAWSDTASKTLMGEVSSWIDATDVELTSGFVEAAPSDSIEWADTLEALLAQQVALADSADAWQDEAVKELGVTIQAITATPADQAADWSDSITGSLSFLASLSDSTPWADEAGAFLTLSGSLADSLPPSDSVFITLGLLLFPADANADFSDLAALSYGLLSQPSDSIDYLDLVSAFGTVSASLTDATAWQDSLDAVEGMLLLLSDQNADWVDAVGRTLAFLGGLTAAPSDDLDNWQDSLAGFFRLNAQLSDSMTMTDRVRLVRKRLGVAAALDPTYILVGVTPNSSQGPSIGAM